MNYYLNNEYCNLEEVALAHKRNYSKANPFPSISFSNFFNPEVLDKVLDEFPDLTTGDTLRFNKPKEIKLASKGEALLGKETKKFVHFLNSEPFLIFLQKLTGIKETILSDPYLSGGGLHEIQRGGLLKVHADFNSQPDTKLDRRINAIVYLNKNWREDYGGHLELWDKNMENCENKILPEFNTLAIFSTTSYSYHGHPNPLNCPENMSRKSLALYYYSNGRPKGEISTETGQHNTIFKERKGSEMDEQAFQERSVIQKIKSIFT